MGQFLAMSGVLSANEESVVDALCAYAESNEGSLVDDFMNKVGLDFPIDDHGPSHGITFRFECKQGDAS